MFNILIFGSTGHLGKQIRRQLESHHFNLICPNRHIVLEIINGSLNISNFDLHTIDFVINCVSIVGNQNVSQVTDPILYNINTFFPLRLAQLAKKYKFRLLQISTNSVFDNSYSRYRYYSTPTSANSRYGITKLKAEQNIQSLLSPRQYTILRIPHNYSTYLSPRNFLFGFYKASKNNNLICLNNEIISIASIKQIALQIQNIILDNRYGILHASEYTEFTWELILKTISKVTGLPYTYASTYDRANQMNSSIYSSLSDSLQSELNYSIYNIFH